MLSCLNCIEIDNHVFGLYAIVGFMDQDNQTPIDGCWAGLVYIRSARDFTSSFPNNITMTEGNVNNINSNLKSKSLNESVLVANDLKDKIIEAYFNKQLLLLEIITLNTSVYGKTVPYNAVISILPYDKPIVSKTVKRESIQ